MNIVEIKTCKICNKEKSISEFRIIDYNPVNICKECQKDKRRKQSGSTYVNDKYVAGKVCSICKEEKLRTEDNFSCIDKKGGYKKYAKACLECMKAYISPTPRKRNRNLEVGRENEMRMCITCEKEYPLSKFYYSWNNKVNKCYHSKQCNKCENERKKIEKSKYTPERRELYLERIRNHYKSNISSNQLRQYKKFDYERTMDNDLSLEYIKESLKNHCIYCGFPSTGFDRKDNKIGHTKSNCVPCCSECNTARMHNFSHEEMKIIGEAIQYVKRERQGDNPIVSLINNLIPIEAK